MVCTDCHTFKPLFSPLHQPQTPVFTKNCHTQSAIFSHCPECRKFFTQETPNRLEFEKKVPNAPYFYDWKTPYFLPCMHGMHMFVWGECCSLKHGQKLETFVFSKQNPAIWWILGEESKISVLQAQPTQLCIMDEFHWRAGMIHRPLSPWSNTEGDISRHHPLQICSH